MTSQDNAPDFTQTLRRWARGAVTGASAAAVGLGSIAADLRLLMRRWNGGAVIRQRAVGSFQMLVRTDEEVGRRIYFHAKYEEQETGFIRQSIRRTDICFDIGANLGYYTLLLASLAREGTVHAFEPVPLNYHLLCATCLSNRFEHVVVNPCAVGDDETEVNFVVAKDTAYSSLRDTGRKPIAGAIRVPMSTVDAYCRRSQISRVDFLKADVEGAEQKVLAGAQEVLSDENRRPRLVLLELHGPMLEKHGSSIESVLETMTDYGYTPYVCCDGLVPFLRERWNRFENVFFLPSDSQPGTR